jgi:hypothetical protein
MNVKQWITNSRSELFKRLDEAKHDAYRGGFEPIPDVVIFSPAVEADWRRRRRDHTISCMLAVIEVKASERKESRLGFAEGARDIRKLVAHREEAAMIFTPPCWSWTQRRTKPSEWMAVIFDARQLAKGLGVEWR